MKNVRMFIVGLVSGVMLATAASAFAASETVQATFEKFLLVVNGSEPQEIEPLTYKGTTYLPVRDVANRLGYDVTYKADGKTITLTKNENKDVSDVSTITEPKTPETSMPEYIPLKDLGSYGVTVEEDGEFIRIIYGDTVLTFTHPKPGNVQMISGGYSIKRVGDEIYFNSFSLQKLLEENQ